MSGKFLARASALALVFALSGCGGDGSSTPLVDPGNNGGPGDPVEVTLELGTGVGSSFQAGKMNLSAKELSSGGITRMEFNVVNASNGNEIYNAEETSVTISSTCDKAVFDTPVLSTSGKFSVTYEAGCAGPDTITARLDNGASATANVFVAPQEVGALSFVSVDPDSIAIAGSGNSSRSTVSTVTFKLVDNTNKPIEGQELSFSLSTQVGGITLSRPVVETGANGEASTTVNSGTIATVVSVTARATLPTGKVIETSSAPISISSSIPDQDSFSISVEENFLPNAWRYDGVEVPMTIRAADRNNNRISGAIVNFLTNGGSVQNECAMENGACAVQWISQSPRPSNGVVSVLARTVGEESFQDTDSDGLFTPGTDVFQIATNDKGEAYLDVNRNGRYDANESYFDYNENGRYDLPNGRYDGTACTDTNRCNTSLLEVFETARVFMASDDLEITPVTSNDSGSDFELVDGTPTLVINDGQSYATACLEIGGRLSSENVGPPPGGTTISFDANLGSILDPASLESTKSFTTDPITACAIIDANSNDERRGLLTVQITPPEPYGGTAYIVRYPIRDDNVAAAPN